MRYYGQIENGEIVEGKYGAQIPFNFLLLQNTKLDTKTGEYKLNIEDWMNSMPKGNKIQANWVVSLSPLNLRTSRFSGYLVKTFFFISDGQP